MDNFCTISGGFAFEIGRFFAGVSLFVGIIAIVFVACLISVLVAPLLRKKENGDG